MVVEGVVSRIIFLQEFASRKRLVDKLVMWESKSPGAMGATCCRMDTERQLLPVGILGNNWRQKADKHKTESRLRS
jgi:hypothetical protein